MSEERRSTGDTDQQTCGPRAGRAIAELAAAQHGVASRSQLIALGVSETMIRDRMRSGQLIPLHRGVYAVGHRRLRREGFWLAATLAAGPGAALSHRDAAALHGLRPSNHANVDVTTPRRGRQSQRGIAVHHAILTPLDVTTRAGIPVTTLARTLVDLASVVPPDHVRRALAEADRRRQLDVTSLEAVLRRTHGRHGPGHARLTQALAALAATGPQLTRSALEDRFLALLDAHGLPRPRVNEHVEGFEVDACWRDRRLIVELDGYAFHRGRAAFQRDRDRTNALTAAGWTVLRQTYEDVLQRPEQLAARVRALLAP